MNCEWISNICTRVGIFHFFSIMLHYLTPSFHTKQSMKRVKRPTAKVLAQVSASNTCQPPLRKKVWKIFRVCSPSHKPFNGYMWARTQPGIRWVPCQQWWQVQLRQVYKAWPVMTLAFSSLILGVKPFICQWSFQAPRAWRWSRYWLGGGLAMEHPTEPSPLTGDGAWWVPACTWRHVTGMHPFYIHFSPSFFLYLLPFVLWPFLLITPNIELKKEMSKTMQPCGGTQG